MTIAEAVEIYNKTKAKIDAINALAKRTIDQNGGSISMQNPMGYYEISPKDMQEIGKYLTEYRDTLKNMLDEAFR